MDAKLCLLFLTGAVLMFLAGSCAPGISPPITTPTSVALEPTVPLATSTPSPQPQPTVLPTLTSTVQPTPEPTATATATSTPTPPEHRIGVRVVNGDGEFYDRTTGKKFTPRGATYTRLGPIKTQSGVITYHTTFQVGNYDGVRSDAALAQMAQYGYNTVQVEVHGCEDRCVANPATGALSGAYLDNVVDLLRRAKAHNLFVLLRVDDLPHGSSYADHLFQKHWRADVQSVNAQFLTVEGVEANAEYMTDLIRALIARRAPLDIILGYAIRGEAFLEAKLAPFTLTSGSLSTANGKTYNLGSSAERYQMIDDSFVFFTDKVRAAIRQVDPTALVGIGLFAPQSPHPWRVGDSRLTSTRGLVTRSTADFVDFHPYPGEELSLGQFMENYGVDRPPTMALMMSEYGSFKRTYRNILSSAQANGEWQAASCQYGYDGWLWWTWDTIEQGPPMWSAIEENGTIADALSPIKRSDPCAPWTGPTNIAKGKPVKVSAMEQYPASRAVDGLSATSWGAGRFAPAWIEIDLGYTTNIARVILLTGQSPAGDTVHRVLGRGEDEGWRLLHQFEKPTADGETLEARAQEPWLNIRYVRIETVKSPSWVAWREIEVYPP